MKSREYKNIQVYTYNKRTSHIHTLTYKSKVSYRLVFPKLFSAATPHISLINFTIPGVKFLYVKS